MDNTLQSGYKTNTIILKDCKFSRETKVTFDFSLVKHNINLEVNVNVNGNETIVTVTLKFSQTHEEQVEFSADISYIGVFEKVGNPVLSDEDFGNQNAPAIIFPYLREQLSNLAAKAGIGLVMLPPINFSNLKKQEARPE